jgi:hypothetical protein
MIVYGQKNTYQKGRQLKIDKFGFLDFMLPILYFKSQFVEIGP